MFRSLLLGTAVMITGCATTKPAYRSDIKVFSPSDAGQYDIFFTVEDISDPSEPNLLSAPQVRVVENQEATVFVGDDNNSLHFTAIVNENEETEVATVKTTVLVKEKGEVVWTQEQTVYVKED